MNENKNKSLLRCPKCGSTWGFGVQIWSDIDPVTMLPIHDPDYDLMEQCHCHRCGYQAALNVFLDEGEEN